MKREKVKIKVFFYDRLYNEKGVTGFRDATIELPKEAMQFKDREKRILVLEQLAGLLNYKSWEICWRCLNNYSSCISGCPLLLMSSKILSTSIETDFK